MQPTINLTSDQIAFFQREGYLALEAVTPPEEIDRLREVYDHIFAVKAGRDEGNQFDLAGTDEEDGEAALPQILQPSKYAPELRQSHYHTNALHLVQQLLGPEMRWTGEHAILKPAQHGAETPWHQDEAYWDPAVEPLAVSVWMPLQPATLENGCMWFVPGTHKLPVLPHHTVNHDPRIHALEVDPCPQADTSRAVACPLPPGGCTVHFSRTLHYTGPNRTDQPRRAYILTFAGPARKLAEPRDFHWNRTKQTARQERAKRWAESTRP